VAKTITATVRKRTSLGGTGYLYMGTLTPDTSYETGGDTITNPSEGLKLPEKFDALNIQPSVGGYIATWDSAAGKVKIMEGAAGVLKEVAAAANLSGQTFNYIAIGA
jgi:hypothetical protein